MRGNQYPVFGGETWSSITSELLTHPVNNGQTPATPGGPEAGRTRPNEKARVGE